MAPRSCTEFLESFVLPLVCGGPLHVGEPIDVLEIQGLENALDSASVAVVAIDEARVAVLSELVVSPPHFIFGPDELYLAASIHNLLYLAHPNAEGFSLSESKRAKIVAAAQQFATRSRFQNRTKVLARHALLHNFFDIGRTDIRLSWWTGSSEFIGQQPPPRLLRWRNVRKVSETESQVSFQKLFQGADVSAVVISLLRRSPLTWLLDKGRRSMHLHWEEVVFLLRDAELARVISYQSLGSAPSTRLPDQDLQQCFRYAQSFQQMLDRSPKESDVRTVAAFLVHLNILLALQENSLRGDRSPLLTKVLAKKTRPKGMALFLALPGALAKVDPHLATPPGLEKELILAQRWSVHRKQVLESLGKDLVDGLATLLERHLKPTGVLGSETLHHNGTATT